MASGGGGGSSFNPFKRKGRLLTPKLRKREISPKEPEKDTDHEGRKDEVVAQSRPETAQPAEGPVVTVVPCDRPDCTTDCHINSHSTGSRLSNSSENLGPNVNKAALKRKSKTLTLRRKKNETNKNSGKGSKFWTFRIKKKLPLGLNKRKLPCFPEAPAPVLESGSCVCTSYRRSEDTTPQNIRFSTAGGSLMGASASPIQPNSTRNARLALGAGPGPTGVRRFNPQLFQLVPAPQQSTTVIDMTRTNPDEFPTEDIDEMMIAQRARDMELGIEISPSHFAYPHLHYSSSVSSSSSSSGSSTVSEQTSNLSLAFQNQCVVTTTTLYPGASDSMISRESYRSHESEYGEFSALAAPSSAAPGSYIPRTVHTQVDYIHCLVPDLIEITKCSFYWGVIDRYEAERLLENRPEGTFLLRDSAQEEFLFSVSFRRYGRSLHARIEQWNHKFSFDSHDPGVFASDTVCGLIEHYKDPSCCMFFEPMLTNPLNRTFPFSLQHLCRTVICNSTTYDGLNFLPLPKTLRDYLKYYHYKQKVRVRRFEVHH